MKQRTSEKLPFLVTVSVFIVIFVLNLMAFSYEAPGSPLLSTFYSSLSLFLASYVPLPPQEDAPSSLISVLGMLSIAAFSAVIIVNVFDTARGAWGNRRASRIKDALVIIGSGKNAMGVLRNATRGVSDATAGQRPAVVLISDFEETGTAPPSAYVVRSSFSTDGLTPQARRVIKSARDIIVATDDDALNRQLTQSIGADITSNKSRVVGVIGSPRYADELRPPVIDGKLPPTDYTSPHENISQLVSVLVDFISLDTALGLGNRPDLVVQIDDVDGRSGDLAWAIRLALTRLSRARTSMRNLTRPRLEVRASHPNPSQEQCPNDVSVNVLVGGNPAEVAAALLAKARQHDASKSNDARPHPPITIGITDVRLLPEEQSNDRNMSVLTSGVRVLDARKLPGKQDILNGATLALDRDAVGLDDKLVLDTLESCWGRIYHNAHGLMHRAMEPWNYHSHHRNEQSSIGAVRTMLEQLAEHGYALYRTDSEPRHTLPSGPEAEEMARAEHEAWRTRKWVDPATGRTLMAPQRLESDGEVRENSADRPFGELDENTRRYNKRVPLEIYPAVAASMGYEIRKRTGHVHDQHIVSSDAYVADASR